MRRVLTDDFLLRAREEFEQYTKDYESAIVRSKELEEEAQIRADLCAKNAEILESFGVIL